MFRLTGYQGPSCLSRRTLKWVGSEKVARIGIKAQACTPAICKDISKELELDLGLAAGPAEAGVAALSAVRTQ